MAQLFFDFDDGNQSMIAFDNDLVEKFRNAVEAGTFVGSAELQDGKPDVPQDCDVAAMNDEIDAKAAELKSLTDLVEFLPTELCSGLNGEIQAVIDANKDAGVEPANAAVAIIGDLAMINQIATDDLENFNVNLYNEYLESGIARENPGFA